MSVIGEDLSSSNADILAEQQQHNMSSRPSSSFDANSSTLSMNTSTSQPKQENETAEVINGRLNLSNRFINYLSSQFSAEYARTIHLDVSNNSFHTFHNMERFSSCTEINVSRNEITKLSSLLKLAKQLRYLDVSHNTIVTIAELKFFVNLQRLDISDNFIHYVPLLEMKQLTHLDMANNRLTGLPNLVGFSSLEFLSLEGNDIESLENATHLLPHTLKTLNISQNKINDLSQLYNLLPFVEIIQLFIDGNPCVANAEFNYRCYVFSILPNNLQFVEKKQLSAQEKLQGEELYVQGRIRKFLPGSHDSLVQVLERKCPRVAVDSPMPDRLSKIMDKFNEYSHVDNSDDSRRLDKTSDMTDDESNASNSQSISLSAHSPFRNWSNKLNDGKENRQPFDVRSLASESKSLDRDQKERLRNMQSRDLNVYRTSLPGSVGDGHELEFTSPSVSSRIIVSSCPSTSPTITPLQERSSESNSNTARSSDVVTPTPKPKPRSIKWIAEIERYPPVEQVEEEGDGRTESEEERSDTQEEDEYEEDEKKGRDEEDCIDGRLDAGAGERMSARVKVVDVSMEAAMRTPARRKRQMDQFRSQLDHLASQVAELQLQNEKLTETNALLTDLLEQMPATFEGRIADLRKEMQECQCVVAAPSNLQVRQETDEYAEVYWTMPKVQGFKVFIDGNECGTVKAPNNVARITQLDPDREHVIELQAIALNGRISEMSSQLFIPKKE